MNKIEKYWKSIKVGDDITCPNVSLFRFLGHLNFSIQKKKILEIGFGHGADLMQFKKKGANVFGIDINKNYVNKIKKNKIKNVQCADCGNDNINFRNHKFDLIYHRDVIYYLQNKKINFLHENIYRNLKRDGVYIFQYIENDFIKKKNIKKNKFYLNVKKNFFLKKIAEKNNPLRYLNSNFLLKNCKINKLKLFGEKILIESYGKNLEKIRVNKYLAFKKIQ